MSPDTTQNVAVWATKRHADIRHTGLSSTLHAAMIARVQHTWCDDLDAIVECCPIHFLANEILLVQENTYKYKFKIWEIQIKRPSVGDVTALCWWRHVPIPLSLFSSRKVFLANEQDNIFGGAPLRSGRWPGRILKSSTWKHVRAGRRQERDRGELRAARVNLQKNNNGLCCQSEQFVHLTVLKLW